MHMRKWIFVGLLSAAAALPASAEPCGKNRKATMFLEAEPPKYRLGSVAGEEVKLTSADQAAQFVVAASTQDVGSVSVVTGSGTYDLEPCEITIKGYRGFEVSSKDLRRFTATFAKGGVAKLRVKWRKNDNSGKLYVAEREN